MLGYVEDKTTLFILSLVVRGVEGNGSAMLNVAAASLILKTYPDKAGTMSVCKT